MAKDIGNQCIKCFNDTSYGSGRFVDRIPAGDDYYDGYMCILCQNLNEEDYK